MLFLVNWELELVLWATVYILIKTKWISPMKRLQAFFDIL